MYRPFFLRIWDDLTGQELGTIRRRDSGEWEGLTLRDNLSCLDENIQFVIDFIIRGGPQ